MYLLRSPAEVDPFLSLSLLATLHAEAVASAVELAAPAKNGGILEKLGSVSNEIRDVQST